MGYGGLWVRENVVVFQKKRELFRFRTMSLSVEIC